MDLIDIPREYLTPIIHTDDAPTSAWAAIFCEISMNFLTKMLQEASEAIFELENRLFLDPSRSLLSITMGSGMVFEVQKVLGKQYNYYCNDLRRI